MTSRAIRRSRKGHFDIRLPAAERALLRSLAPQMRELLSSDDPVLERLYPVAYPDDEDRETEYRLLVRDELRSSTRPRSPRWRRAPMPSGSTRSSSWPGCGQ